MDVFLKPKSLSAPSLPGFTAKKSSKPTAAKAKAKTAKAAQAKPSLVPVPVPVPVAVPVPVPVAVPKEPEPKSFAEAYKRACFSRPQPPEEHLAVAVDVLCCSIQFTWEVGFWIVVDELLSTGKAFLERNAKLLKILQQSRGKSKGKEKAKQIWDRTRDKFKYELQVYVQLYRRPDPLLAYLHYRYALVTNCHLGLPVEF